MHPAPSLILIGFMASGKSTVGQLLSGRLSLPFVDTDALVERRAGMTIPEIFKTQGETAFRDLEHEAARSLCSLGPSVIATGGGLPTFARNVPHLRAAGTVVLLDRPFEAVWRQLAGDAGRPLAGGKSREVLLALYEMRLPLYRAAADIVVPSHATVRETAEAVLEAAKTLTLSSPPIARD